VHARFPSPAPAKKLILLVEDDSIHASMMCQILAEETAHEVYHTSDAHTAWRFLQDVKPHLLLLDYRLSGMNGLDLYDRVHADPRLKDLPVLLVSVSIPEREVLIRGLTYLKKPFELDDFLQQIEALLSSS